jgi:adenosylhomocysteine nucleosidase
MTKMPQVNARVAWVFALAAEAQPVIDKIGLKPWGANHPFPCFHHPNHSQVAVISGIGKVNAAAASMHLYHKMGGRQSDAWLNLGIAGDKTHPQGTLLLVHKLTDTANNTIWYPRWLLEKDCVSWGLTTVDRPSIDYPSFAAVDMEASGFYPTATRIVSQELVHILKVVSDGPDCQIDKVTPAIAKRLIGDNLASITTMADRLLTLSDDEARRLADPAQMDVVASHFHFTTTQKVQLKKLLRRHQVLRGADDNLTFDLSQASTAKDFLRTLEIKVNQWSLQSNHL